MTIDRRSFLGGGGALAAALWIGGAGEALAALDDNPSICLYSRGRVASRARFRPPSARAQQIVSGVSRMINYGGRIEVYESPSISNAGAVPGRRGRPHLILYNADFMNALDRLHPNAPVSVLAHEIGHFTARSSGARGSWDRELTADHAGGCIMNRLGADPDSATVAVRALWSHGNRSHPDTPRRIRAILDGYHSCLG